MKKFYVKYQTSDDGTHWCDMPHKVPIEASTVAVARIRFGAIFQKCFGHELEYRILGVDNCK